MSKYVRGDTRVRSLCRWKCAYCGEKYVTMAVITASASQVYGPLGNSREEASAKVKVAIEKEIAKSIRKVNEKHIVPKNVIIPGKCDKCGQLQPWEARYIFRSIRIAISIIISISVGWLWFWFLESYVEDELLWEVGLFVWISIVFLSVSGVSEGVKWLIEHTLLKKSGAVKDECYPELIGPVK